jgi:PhnB protein
MPSLNPYLNFNGNTEEAFNFYKSAFGGEFVTMQRFKDTPEAEKMPEGDRNKIMHAALPIGKGNMLMGTDSLESMGQKLVVGNNFYISIDTESEDEANKLFNSLSGGGKVELPMQKTFWGSYFGMFKDKFGIQWMISYNEKRP